MPARDLYHNLVVKALVLDGWTITDDPLTISYGGRDLFIDLGAEDRTIAAEKQGRKIAVEIKSFLSTSILRDLEDAVGQYEIYGTVLAEVQPDRILYLAVPQRAFESIFSERFGQLILERRQLRLIVFEEQVGRIIQWQP